MRALLAAVLLAVPASLRAASVCESSWLDSYASDWGYARAQWQADCAAGLDPQAGLRRAQSEFMSACQERFHRPDAGAAGPQAEIYCALGKPGRAKLYALAGLPDPDLVPPPPPPDEGARVPPPGVGAMGPLMQSLRDARAKWKPDACFSGLAYAYVRTPSTTEDAWESAKRAHQDPSYSLTYLEVFDYAFHSSEIELGGYRVSYGDKIDSLDCTGLTRQKGPDVSGFPHDPFFSRCLSRVKLDVGQAFGVVFPKATAAPAKATAMLGTMTREVLEGTGCTVDTGGSIRGTPCAEVPDWSVSARRAALGKEVWLVTAGDRTDVVDAATGKKLGWAHGSLRPRSLGTVLYGNPCPIPRILNVR